MIHYGLVAGVGSLSELGRRTPGEICDWYVLRQRYDDQQHGIRRERR